MTPELPRDAAYFVEHLRALALALRDAVLSGLRARIEPVLLRLLREDEAQR